MFILANMGVWYNTHAQNHYRIDLKIALDWLQSMALLPSANNTVAFIETLPTHWDLSNGYYAEKKRKHVVNNNGHCCFEIVNKSFEADWRNSILHEFMRLYGATNYSRITIIPIAEPFREAHTMHSCSSTVSSKEWDCTHYCFFPTMMQYLWHTLSILSSMLCIGDQCKLISK